jgi:hypothetical protein
MAPPNGRRSAKGAIEEGGSKEEKEGRVKRHLATIVMVVLALGLAIYLWLDKAKITSTERLNRENSVFPVWRREDLTRIEIAHEGETLILVHDLTTDTWRMTSPRTERVDHAAVERLTTTLEFATAARKVGPGDNLGFDRPRASGTVTMGAISFRFAVGALSPRPEGSRYMRVDEGEPFVASKELSDALVASSDTYRDRSVIPYLSIELAKFEVEHPSGGFVIQRQDERSFNIPALGVLASRAALDKVWGALAEMRAESFPKDADADRLTAHPRLTIRLSPRDSTASVGELVVGDSCPGHEEDLVVLRKTPTRAAACAPKGAIEALERITPNMLVDRHPFSFRHDEIEELRLEGDGARPIEVARRGAGFHEREPTDRELSPEESEAMSDLLAAFDRIEAFDVRPGAGTPFAAHGKAKIWSGDNDEIVEVGSTADESVVIRRIHDDARLTVSPANARRLSPRETTLRPLALLIEPRKVTRVALRCGVNQDFVDTGQGLRLVEPAGYETDGTVTQLVDGIVRGKVLAWTADRDDGSFGLSPNGCRVVLSYADGNAPATIHFGDVGEGGVYGNIDGRSEVFVAATALADLAKRIYVSRAAFRIDPATIERVTVSLHGKALPLEDLAPLREAVGALFADRVVSLGAPTIGAADFELLIVAEGGAPKRIACGPEVAGVRRCATPAVKALFEVPAATIARFLPTVIPDAGAVDGK